MHQHQPPVLPECIAFLEALVSQTRPSLFRATSIEMVEALISSGYFVSVPFVRFARRRPLTAAIHRALVVGQRELTYIAFTEIL